MDSRPKPTFETLPAELKIRIAEMCKAQDGRMHDGLLDLEYEIDAADDYVTEHNVWVRELKERRFDSLGSLFQVSRSWHEVVAPIKFRARRVLPESSSPACVPH